MGIFSHFKTSGMVLNWKNISKQKEKIKKKEYINAQKKLRMYIQKRIIEATKDYITVHYDYINFIYGSVEEIDALIDSVCPNHWNRERNDPNWYRIYLNELPEGKRGLIDKF